MRRSLKDIFIGLVVFVIISVVVIWLVYIGLLIPPQIIDWLHTSPDPQQAVIAFGALTSAIFLILLRGGVAIPFLQRYLPDTEQSRRYVAGLPLWVIGILIALSLVGLLLVRPACQPPTSVTFETSDNGVLHPFDTLLVKPGETISILAKSVEDGVRLDCQWQYGGTAFPTLGTRQGCDIQVAFSPKPGEGYLTLLASNNFCTQSSLFSLPVKVEQP
ncbi:MAG: hypothetical protein WA821_09520 [Anaerolineales bacterium]